jgi:uncharacterized damage-inducible protein DinB
MENPNQLANRFREVLLNGKWIANTNYKEQCSTISWEQAIKKVGSLNTIAALTFHINYYLDGIINVFDGGTLDIRDKYSFDMPPIKSKEDWETLLSELVANAEKVADHVDQMSEKRLEENFVDEKYGTYRRNIEAVIEHGYYHLGQISLIKKMIMELESKK